MPKSLSALATGDIAFPRRSGGACTPAMPYIEERGGHGDADTIAAAAERMRSLADTYC